MVIRANKTAEGIGGHLSTFASSAAQYEVGFNHFFRGKADGQSGDAVYFQGHAAPGVYARAYLEGRLTEDQLDRFRLEVGGGGLSSYPHPRLMPEFWEYPTVSMGLGPINSIYQARFLRYLHNRQIDDTSGSRVWCFVGDGEADEPETLGSISLAAREGLDNLTWVVNCNLQRLDGPVRGNGKIIQELEAIFRGAGWNVIKVIWGGRWDELLARDVNGVLVNKMNETVDGTYQRYAVEDGAFAREHFFGPDPRLRDLAAHLSDDDIRSLPRGGHDYRKLYAAYKAATEQTGAPTAILAKTVKGWTLGPGFEGRNATHQIKKMTVDELKALRDRLHLHEEIPERRPRRRRPAVLPAGRGLRRVPLHDGAPPGPGRGRAQPGGPGPPARDAPGRLGLRRVRHRFRHPGGVDHDGLHPHPAEPGPGRVLRAPRRAHRPRRGPDLRHGLAVPGVRDLRPLRPALRARRPRPAAVLHRGPGRPDPRGGHHRGRRPGQLDGGGDLVRQPGHADAALLRLLLDVRVPAGGRPDLGRGRRPGPGLPDGGDGRAHDPAGRGPPAPGRPQPRPGLHGARLRGLRPGLRLRAGRDRAGRDPPHVPRRRRHPGRGRLLLPDPLQRELRHAGQARGRRRRHPRGPLPLRPGPGGHHPPRDRPLQRFGPRGGPGGPGRAGRALRRGRRPLVGHLLQAPPGGGHGRRAVEPPPPDRRPPHAAGDRAPGRGRGPGRGRHRLHAGRARPGVPLVAPPVAVPGHRRLRPQRHPRDPAPLLRDRHGPRRGGGPQLAWPRTARSSPPSWPRPSRSYDLDPEAAPPWTR